MCEGGDEVLLVVHFIVTDHVLITTFYDETAEADAKKVLDYLIAENAGNVDGWWITKILEKGGNLGKP